MFTLQQSRAQRMRWQRSRCRGVTGPGLLLTMYIASWVIAGLTAPESGRNLGEAMQAARTLEETMPRLKEDLQRDWEQAVRDGRLTRAQYEIQLNRLQQNSDLIDRLGQELIEKQKELQSGQVKGNVLSIASQIIPDTLKSGGRALASWAASGAGMVTGADSPVVNLDDVKGTWNELQASWNEPQDPFVRAQLGAAVRNLLDEFRGTHGVQSFAQMTATQRRAIRDQLNDLSRRLDSEGWIPPGGDWQQFVHNEVRRYGATTGQLRPDQYVPHERGGTIVTARGGLDPGWAARARAEAAKLGAQMNVKGSVATLSITLDNQCTVTPVTFEAEMRDSNEHAYARFRLTFTPQFVSRTHVKGTYVLRLEEGWRVQRGQRQNIAAADLSRPNSGWEAIRQSDGDWLLFVTDDPKSNEIDKMVWRLKPG